MQNLQRDSDFQDLKYIRGVIMGIDEKEKTVRVVFKSSRPHT
jgi:hypothetical protein